MRQEVKEKIREIMTRHFEECRDEAQNEMQLNGRTIRFDVQPVYRRLWEGSPDDWRWLNPDAIKELLENLLEENPDIDEEELFEFADEYYKSLITKIWINEIDDKATYAYVYDYLTNKEIEIFKEKYDKKEYDEIY